MNVNFSVFIDKILSGEKRQTIRRAGFKWGSVKVGDKLTLYTGLRTKECRKLGEAVVESITPITINTSENWVAVNSPLGWFYLDTADQYDLLRRDGFDTQLAFYSFFTEHYKLPQNAMVVIRWKDFKEAE